MPVITDWLTTSHPAEDLEALHDRLSPILSRSGGIPDPQGWGFELGRDRGRVRVSRQHAVATVSASGVALSQLKAANLFLDYLATLGAVPHRVTRLDVALDLPVDAHSVLPILFDRGRAGQVALSRKAVAPKAVRYVNRLDPDGYAAGTVYFGDQRSHDVTARVYCKRSERRDKGHPDPGPLTRYEVTLRSGCRATLRDAAEPGPIFWHYASPGLLDRPPNARKWVPHGEGFTLPDRVPSLAADRLKGLVERGYADPLLRLVGDLGAHGLDYLHGVLERRLRHIASSGPEGTRAS